MVIWNDDTNAETASNTRGSKSILLAFLMVPFETLRLQADADKSEKNKPN